MNAFDAPKDLSLTKSEPLLKMAPLKSLICAVRSGFANIPSVSKLGVTETANVALKATVVAEIFEDISVSLLIGGKRCYRLP